MNFNSILQSYNIHMNGADQSWTGTNMSTADLEAIQRQLQAMFAMPGLASMIPNCEEMVKNIIASFKVS